MVRLAGTLAGDIRKHDATRIKYGLFFDALARQFDLVDVCDVSLHGAMRMWNAVQSFHPDKDTWRKRYWQNLPTFRARSKIAANYVESLKEKIDAIMQISVLFDSWFEASVPSFIYTDYTAALSAQRPDAGRSPFTPRQLAEWLKLEQRAYQRAGHIFTRGEFVRDSIIADYGISPEKVSAVGGGVGFVSLPEAVGRRENGAPVILFIGRDFYRKGGDLLLKAFANTRQDFPDAKLRIMTRDRVDNSFSMDGVELLPSAWNRDEVLSAFKSADLFVLPSRLETWGDVLLEAMAFSLPCVGIREGGMPEIIVDGVTGMLVEPESVDGLTHALDVLLGDAALREQYGFAARERVEKMFTWDHVVSIMKPTVVQFLS